MTNIILVDDHSLFRLGIKSALDNKYSDICIAGEAADGETLFDLLQTTTADMVLLDIFLPDMSGVEIARRLRQEYPQIKILVISIENTTDMIQVLLEIGIDGFISKQQGTGEELADAIRTIMGGMEYFGKDIASMIYNIYVSKRKSTGIMIEFTEREREIINLCRDGLQSKEIADRLCISPRTVDTHKNNIFKKLGINSTLEMVRYALQHGIISMS